MDVLPRMYRCGCIAALTFATALSANVPQNCATGLAPLSAESNDYIEKNWPTVVSVQPNKIGLERIQHHRKSKKLPLLATTPASQAEEITLVVGKQARDRLHSADPALSTYDLPPSVDNSTLPAFPTIGNQQELHSSVAWATTYYQASHEKGLLNGFNNQKSNQSVFSPKWTYNALNGGDNKELSIPVAYKLLNTVRSNQFRELPL